eukprot:RCo008544
MSLDWITTRPCVVLFGDSITERGWTPDEDPGSSGWVALLCKHFSRRADILVRGFSGYNTRWALRVMPSCFMEKTKPLLITIFFGANDASLLEENPVQHVPVEEYKTNLASIVAFLRSQYQADVPIVLITPPPVCGVKRLQYQQATYGPSATGRLERTNESAGTYAAACEEVGASLGLPVLNVWKLMQEAGSSLPGGFSDYLVDGLHFTTLGHRFFFDRLVELLERQPTLQPQRMPMIWPDKGIVDWRNPDNTFVHGKTIPPPVPAPVSNPGGALAGPATATPSPKGV